MLAPCRGLRAATPTEPSTIAPVFETGDPRYSWLNEVQAVGKGILSADLTTLDYEICEVR